MLKFTIFPYCQTRRTSYRLKDVVKAIHDAGLQFTRPIFLVEVIVTSLDERKRLEYNLKLVHRNIAYLITPIQMEQTNE